MVFFPEPSLRHVDLWRGEFENQPLWEVLTDPQGASIVLLGGPIPFRDLGAALHLTVYRQLSKIFYFSTRLTQEEIDSIGQLGAVELRIQRLQQDLCEAESVLLELSPNADVSVRKDMESRTTPIALWTGKKAMREAIQDPEVLCNCNPPLFNLIFSVWDKMFCDSSVRLTKENKEYAQKLGITLSKLFLNFFQAPHVEPRVYLSNNKDDEHGDKPVFAVNSILWNHELQQLYQLGLSPRYLYVGPDSTRACQLTELYLVRNAAHPHDANPLQFRSSYSMGMSLEEEVLWKTQAPRPILPWETLCRITAQFRKRVQLKKLQRVKEQVSEAMARKIMWEVMHQEVAK